MRTTLTIDDEVLDSAREIAAAEGRSVGAVVSDLARRSLTPSEIVVRDGLPVFDVPADARAVSSDDVARALDDE